MVLQLRLDERDRRAIAVYQRARRAGLPEAACVFQAHMIQPDEPRLRRAIYQAKVSDPIAFRPCPGVAPAGPRGVARVHSEAPAERGPRYRFEFPGRRPAEGGGPGAPA